ncbi:PD40 domain-containing protein, partial [bacterium]|nr:PD40 domain-containing protein [bacterium]
AVLTRDLGLDALPAGVSPAVRRGLARCLARDAKERLHDINDLRLELMAGVDEPDPAATTDGGSRGLPRWLVPVLMVLVAVAAVAGMRFGHDSVQVPPVPVVRQVIAGAGFNGWSLSALSPDGQTVAWVPISLSGTEPIVLRRLDEFGERRLVGTEDASNPTFSPDSRWLAYLKIGERVLYKVPVEGGAPQRLADCDMMATHIEWADDGYIYFSGGGSNATDRGVHRVPEAGGPRETIVPVTDEETQTYHALRVPGTDWLVYTAETTGSERLSAMNLANGERRALGIQGSSPQFLPPDILLWFRNSGSEVMASRIDPATLTLRGDAFSVLTQVPAATMLRGCYEISRNGTLIFNRSTSGGLMAARRALSFVDRNGRMTPVFPEEASWAQPRVSPDGRHILVREVRTPNCVLWNYDLARGTRVRITVDEDAHNPLWNPVTGGIIFRYDLGSTFIVAERRPDGTGETRPLYQQEKIEVAPTSISRDGRWLLVNALTNGRDVWAIDLEQGGEPIPFITSGFREQNGAMSPDNRWVAYDSDESGREEVYVISWPDGRNRVQISVEGGHDPSWSHDGRTLYFLGERQVMSVGVTPGANLDPGLPEPAFTGPVDDATYNHAYDVMPDGERAVWIAVSAAGEAKADLWVVSGWGGEVRAKLGAR